MEGSRGTGGAGSPGYGAGGNEEVSPRPSSPEPSNWSRQTPAYLVGGESDWVSAQLTGRREAGGTRSRSAKQKDFNFIFKAMECKMHLLCVPIASCAYLDL